MRNGIIVSLLLHVLAIAPLLWMYTPQLLTQPARETAVATRFLAHTVDIEALRPVPIPIKAIDAAPPSEAPAPLTSRAEHTVAVAPVKPETVEPPISESPPAPQVTKEVKPTPKPVPELKAATKPEPALRTEPSKSEPPPSPKPATPPPPTEILAKEEPPAQNDRLAIINDVPASEPSSPAAQAISGETKKTQPDASYLMRIRALLEQYKHYPPMAQRMGIEGEVWLWFVLNRQGKVVDYRIDKGSGNAMLDEEAKHMIEQIAAFPPIPPDVDVDKLELVVPVSFQLAG
ncbi:MAG: energy transducer TonB [Pseudomonadota bacterium]|nr:energy transducer TonB [Pseudomonadota bacterium]